MIRKSVLFIVPDYHNSFSLSNSLRARGWRAAVFVPKGYPSRFLYADNLLRQWSFGDRRGRFGVTANILLSLLQYLVLCIRFRFHVTYGRMVFPPSYEAEFVRWGWCEDDFHIGLQLSRLFGTRHVFIPSGCRDEDLKVRFSQLDGEQMCGNCGFFSQCHDKENAKYIGRARRYAHVRVTLGFHLSGAMSTTPIRYKVLDFDRWTSPNRGYDDRIVVLHSHAAESRNLIPGRNIKGTPIIDTVMERICARYPHVEYRRVTGLKSTEMLVQHQASDIVIDQLFYGHWGSTGIEAMGVGCAVICYLRPTWIHQFRQNFPNAPEIPVLSATKDTLEEVIERLVNDRTYLREVQIKTRQFAEEFFDPEAVSQEFEAMLLGLSRSARQSD